MLPIFLRSFCRHAAIDAEPKQNEGRSRWKQPTTFLKSSLWTQSGWIDSGDNDDNIDGGDSSEDDDDLHMSDDDTWGEVISVV